MCKITFLKFLKFLGFLKFLNPDPCITPIGAFSSSYQSSLRTIFDF